MADICNIDYARFSIPYDWQEMLLKAEIRHGFKRIPLSEIQPGKKVGELTIVSLQGPYATVLCDCGRSFEARIWNLETRTVCRCRECCYAHNSKRQKKPLRSFEINDFCRWIYEKWKKIKERVRHGLSYKEKRIEYCKMFEKYDSFREWIAHFTDPNGVNAAIAYCKNMSIDRIDNFGDYEPNNIQYATVDMQANNRSTNIKIPNEFGENETATSFGRRHDIPVRVILERAKNGTFKANSIINEYRTDGEQMMLFEPATKRAKSARCRR